MSAPRPGSRWPRVLPVAILLAVALHQLARARAEALSPWLGGGFGMFSTTDVGSRRHLHAFVLRPGLRREVEPPPALDDRIERALAHPSERRLRALARALARVPTPDHGPPRAVRIEVWRKRFDPDTLAPRSEILRAIEVPLDGG